LASVVVAASTLTDLGSGRGPIVDPSARKRPPPHLHWRWRDRDLQHLTNLVSPGLGISFTCTV